MPNLERFVERWPVVLIWSGTLLFWLACLYSYRLPVEALFVGPVIAFAGMLTKEYNQRQA